MYFPLFCPCAESKHFSVGLACFSFEADVIAIVQAANEPLTCLVTAAGIFYYGR